MPSRGSQTEYGLGHSVLVSVGRTHEFSLKVSEVLAAWLQVSPGTGKSEPPLLVDSELVKLWDPETIYEVPETGQEQYPEAWGHLEA